VRVFAADVASAPGPCIGAAVNSVPERFAPTAFRRCSRQRPHNVEERRRRRGAAPGSRQPGRAVRPRPQGRHQRGAGAAPPAHGTPAHGTAARGPGARPPRPRPRSAKLVVCRRRATKIDPTTLGGTAERARLVSFRCVRAEIHQTPPPRCPPPAPRSPPAPQCPARPEVLTPRAVPTRGPAATGPHPPRGHPSASSHCTSSRTARPRWLMRSLSASSSSAIVCPQGSSSGTNAGS
jgi:hypothetical protein